MSSGELFLEGLIFGILRYMAESASGQDETARKRSLYSLGK